MASAAKRVLAWMALRLSCSALRPPAPILGFSVDDLGLATAGLQSEATVLAVGESCTVLYGPKL